MPRCVEMKRIAAPNLTESDPAAPDLAPLDFAVPDSLPSNPAALDLYD